MKPCDLSVYDFNEEDEVAETCHQWSKLSNPKFDDVDVSVAMTKYQFLQHAASGSLNHMKQIHTVEQVHVVAIDDDDRGFDNDVSGSPQDSPDKVVSKKSEVCSTLSESILQHPQHFNEDSYEPKSLSFDMEMRFFSPSGLPPENGHISPSSPESPCSNGSVDAEASDGCDSIQESSPSTSGFEHEENYVPMYGQAQDLSANVWNMENMNIIHTDYVSYGNKYYPACLVLFSKTSLKIETSVPEEKSGESLVEWTLDDIVCIQSQWSGSANTAKVEVRFLSKDAGQVENAHGIEVLEFLVHDPMWLQRQEWIISLDLRYQAVWSIELNGKIGEGGSYLLENSESSSDPYIPNFEEPFEEVVYPKGAADAVSISKRDVDLLEPDTFLNDTIIDFYIKFLENEIPSSEKCRFHFFNCFFFRKLADPDKNSSGVFDGKAAFQRVRKWTRKVNIFEKDYIFIPVNYNLHWSLIVICHAGEVANFNDDYVDDSVKVPCILHMDSIRGSHAGLKDLIQSYLLEEWREKKKDSSEDIVLKFSNLRFLSLELPQQDNCSDCGLFLLHYAELFIAEAPKIFNPFQINEFDTFLKPDWFMPAEASLKRVNIQRLIYELLEGRSLESSSPWNHEFQASALPKNKEDNGIEIVSERIPGKSWNTLHSQPVQEMEMGLLDRSLYRNPECSNVVPGLGMRELLEHCEHFDQGVGQPGCPMLPIREEVGTVNHLAASTLGQTELLQLDEVTSEACDVGYTPSDFNLGFRWKLGMSNLGDPEDDLSPPSNCSSDDSEEMMIIECEQGVQGANSGHQENLDQPIENLDSLIESYASASSDMMETPAEDSQELARIFGNNDLEDFGVSNQEEAEEPPNNDLEESHTPDLTETEAKELSRSPEQAKAKELSNYGLEELHTPPEQEVAKNVANNELEESCTPDQEVTKIVASNELEESRTPDQEVANLVASKELEESRTPDQEEAKVMSHLKLEKIEDDGDTASFNEVVEGSASDSDEGRAAKRIRFTLSGDEK